MRPIVLIGFMGAGKTTTANALAEILETKVMSTDEIVESEAGMPIAQVFAVEGEPAFRERESNAVRVAAASGAGCIDCGGGAIVEQKNLLILREAGARIVYLRASLQTLSRRLRDQVSTRPLLAGNLEQTVERMLEERDPAYNAAADLIVDTDESTPEQVAHTIAEAFA